MAIKNTRVVGLDELSFPPLEYNLKFFGKAIKQIKILWL